jgi:type IV secretion system protein VirD4
MPHEITQTMRKDEQIIIIQGHPPLRCGRAIYFRRKDMAAQAGENRFARRG